MWKYFEKKADRMNFWDIGILKIYVMSIGLVVGAFFPTFIKTYLSVFIAIIVITLTYLMYGLFFRNNEEEN